MKSIASSSQLVSKSAVAALFGIAMGMSTYTNAAIKSGTLTTREGVVVIALPTEVSHELEVVGASLTAGLIPAGTGLLEGRIGSPASGTETEFGVEIVSGTAGTFGNLRIITAEDTDGELIVELKARGDTTYTPSARNAQKLVSGTDGFAEYGVVTNGSKEVKAGTYKIAINAGVWEA